MSFIVLFVGVVAVKCVTKKSSTSFQKAKMNQHNNKSLDFYSNDRRENEREREREEQPHEFNS